MCQYMPVIPTLKRTEILRSYFQTAKLKKNMTLATNKKLGKLLRVVMIRKIKLL